MNQKIPLPIDPHLDSILDLWKKHSTIIVKASPGSGKTTRLPWKIASHSDKKVVVLEPRRLAAKLAAQRIADEENFKLGEEVGYHFRFEKNHSVRSKLIFYTEGTFLRLLLKETSHADVGTVILDEFHERHLDTDLALAALRGLQEKYSLKLILMSATLDSNLQQQFPDAGLVEIEGKRFNIEMHYLPNQPSVLNETLETKVRNRLRLLTPDSGDVLVFLPGMREMQRVQHHLGEEFGDVFLLHAELSKEDQARALNPGKRRKIILATNIAESSVTIPGIKVVIDSGIERKARYSPWTGLKTLEDRPITQSSAIQRAGRAGRTSDGQCYRLYAEQDFLNREPYTIPEILTADLTDTCLLAKEFHSPLNWFTPPPRERWEKSLELLTKLGALLDEEITPVGEEMLSYPVSSRIGRTLISGADFTLDQKKRLLSFVCGSIERDPSGNLFRRLNTFLRESGLDPSPWEKALLSGFVDQVARYRRKQNDFIHYSGKTLKAHRDLRELSSEFYLILEITPRLEAYLVVPIEEEWLYELEPFPFTEEEKLSVAETFSLKRETHLGSIVLEEAPLNLDWESLSGPTRSKLLVLAETPFQKRWQAFMETEKFLRLNFWARFHKRASPTLTLEGYLKATGNLSWEGLEEYFVHELSALLEVPSLDEFLPLKINLGGKRDLPVHYPFGLDPYVEAPIQDFYGTTNTPSILKGQVPLSIKLLGPHRMPIQVTRDLRNFWKKTYLEMKKEWQREYPRHHWPDSPETAPPILLKRQLPQN